MIEGGESAMRGNRRGQVTAEMAVLFSFVIAALVFMGTYIQRGSQGSVKGNVDSIGQQFSTEQPWSSRSTSMQHSTDAQIDSSQCSEYDHQIDGDTPTAAACRDDLQNPSTAFVDPTTAL